MPGSIYKTGNSNWGIRITSASRLSFTLIDLNGEGGRRNGMASLSLADPCFQATVYPSPLMELILDQNSSSHREAIESFVREISGRWDCPPVSIRVDQGLPAHNGFGSKTTTLVSIGKAYAALNGVEVSSSDLAKMGGRAGTSGASVNLIDRGGYLVDGGHANPIDFAEDPQKYLLPSRFAKPARVPPVLINVDFPPWPILLMVTEGTKLHGKPELDWFRETLPIPAAEARRTAHHVLMNLSTAVMEADYPAFCKALNELTYQHHYKQEQIATQPQPVQEMFEEASGRGEIDAICISVTGPMCYAFTRQPREALDWCESLRKRGIVSKYWFSRAQNRPCLLEGVPIQ